MTHQRFVWLLLVVVLVALVILLVTGVPLCNRQDAVDAQCPVAVTSPPPAAVDQLDGLETQFRTIEAKAAEVDASGKG